LIRIRLVHLKTAPNEEPTPMLASYWFNLGVWLRICKAGFLLAKTAGVAPFNDEPMTYLMCFERRKK